ASPGVAWGRSTLPAQGGTLLGIPTKPGGWGGVSPSDGGCGDGIHQGPRLFRSFLVQNTVCSAGVSLWGADGAYARRGAGMLFTASCRAVPERRRPIGRPAPGRGRSLRSRRGRRGGRRSTPERAPPVQRRA